jgi:hypothetical protein
MKMCKSPQELTSHGFQKGLNLRTTDKMCDMPPQVNAKSTSTHYN